jgi:GGDEF domain-containing protein
MPEFKDYYMILQVHQDAEPEIVKSAYKRLAQMNHPDISEDTRATERMQLINQAYAVISDPAQRKSFHRQWIAHNHRPQQPQPRPAAPAAEPHAQAQKSLDSYFRSLLYENWTSAYERLSEKDRSMFTLDEFCEWKTAVKELYQMGSYVIKPFRMYDKCVVNDVEYECVFIFSVFLTDRDNRTGKVNEETYTKYVVKEKGQWFVCLGYAQLKPIIYKLKYLATQAPEMDPERVYRETLLKYDKLTGYLSRKGLLDVMEKEIARARRFKKSFCLLLYTIEPQGVVPGVSAKDYMQMCLADAATQLGDALRNIDFAARIAENQLAVLLIETGMFSAQKAQKRLSGAVCQGEGLCYRMSGYIHAYRGETAEDTLLQAEHETRMRVVTGTDNVKRYYINLDDQQV